MFATVTVAALGCVVVASALHAMVIGSRARGAPPERTALVRWSSPWYRLVHAALGLSFLMLASTGLGAAVAHGELGGWWLWGHMAAAPVFALALAAATVSWAERSRFRRGDAEWLRRGGGYLGGPRELPAGRFDAGQKVFFWTGSLLGWIALVSILMTMLPLFGTDGLERLESVHRWTGLVLTALLLVHLYVTLLAKPGSWRGVVTGRVTRSWAERYHSRWCEDELQAREADDAEDA
jgi:formate dehydrogenase subunit gamma